MRITSLVLALGGVSALTGCLQTDGHGQTSASTEDLGSVQLGIAVAPGLDIDSVTYSIQVPDHPALQGTLAVAADGTVHGKIDDVPASVGVLVSLTASNAAGVTCAGEGTVTVLAGEVASLAVGLQCRLPSAPPPTTGAISVSGTFNACPKLTAASAEPPDAAGSSAVTANAEDLDGDTLSFSWAAAAGAFADAAVASTTYTCAAAGAQSLTVTVDDGKGCTHSQMVSVTCPEVAPPEPVCGNDTQEGAEECDDGNTAAGDGCSATCTVEPPPPVEGTDLPCDVQAVVKAKCQSCHSDPPTSAPMALTTLAQFKAPAPAPHADVPVWQRVEARINDASNPMPPAWMANLALTDQEKATLNAWLDAGAPGATCAAPI
jgi:cysteine-rich repeat protein